MATKAPVQLSRGSVSTVALGKSATPAAKPAAAPQKISAPAPKTTQVAAPKATVSQVSAAKYTPPLTVANLKVDPKIVNQVNNTVKQLTNNVNNAAVQLSKTVNNLQPVKLTPVALGSISRSLQKIESAGTAQINASAIKAVNAVPTIKPTSTSSLVGAINNAQQLSTITSKAVPLAGDVQKTSATISALLKNINAHNSAVVGQNNNYLQKVNGLKLESSTAIQKSLADSKSQIKAVTSEALKKIEPEVSAVNKNIASLLTDLSTQSRTVNADLRAVAIDGINAVTDWSKQKIKTARSPEEADTFRDVGMSAMLAISQAHNDSKMAHDLNLKSVTSDLVKFSANVNTGFLTAANQIKTAGALSTSKLMDHADAQKLLAHNVLDAAAAKSKETAGMAVSLIGNIKLPSQPDQNLTMKIMAEPGSERLSKWNPGKVYKDDSGNMFRGNEMSSAQIKKVESGELTEVGSRSSGSSQPASPSASPGASSSDKKPSTQKIQTASDWKPPVTGAEGLLFAIEQKNPGVADALRKGYSRIQSSDNRALASGFVEKGDLKTEIPEWSVQGSLGTVLTPVLSLGTVGLEEAWRGRERKLTPMGEELASNAISTLSKPGATLSDVRPFGSMTGTEVALQSMQLKSPQELQVIAEKNPKLVSAMDQSPTLRPVIRGKLGDDAVNKAKSKAPLSADEIQAAAADLWWAGADVLTVSDLTPNPIINAMAFPAVVGTGGVEKFGGKVVAEASKLVKGGLKGSDIAVGVTKLDRDLKVSTDIIKASKIEVPKVELPAKSSASGSSAPTGTSKPAGNVAKPTESQTLSLAGFQLRGDYRVSDNIARDLEAAKSKQVIIATPPKLADLKPVLKVSDTADPYVDNAKKLVSSTPGEARIVPRAEGLRPAIDLASTKTELQTTGKGLDIFTPPSGKVSATTAADTAKAAPGDQILGYTDTGVPYYEIGPGGQKIVGYEQQLNGSIRGVDEFGYVVGGRIGPDGITIDPYDNPIDQGVNPYDWAFGEGSPSGGGGGSGGGYGGGYSGGGGYRSPYEGAGGTVDTGANAPQVKYDPTQDTNFFVDTDGKKYFQDETGQYLEETDFLAKVAKRKADAEAAAKKAADDAKAAEEKAKAEAEKEKKAALTYYDPVKKAYYALDPDTNTKYFINPDTGKAMPEPDFDAYMTVRAKEEAAEVEAAAKSKAEAEVAAAKAKADAAAAAQAEYERQLRIAEATSRSTVADYGYYQPPTVPSAEATIMGRTYQEIKEADEAEALWQANRDKILDQDRYKVYKVEDVSESATSATIGKASTKPTMSKMNKADFQDFLQRNRQEIAYKDPETLATIAKDLSAAKREMLYDTFQDAAKEFKVGTLGEVKEGEIYVLANDMYALNDFKTWLADRDLYDAAGVEEIGTWYDAGKPSGKKPALYDYYKQFLNEQKEAELNAIRYENRDPGLETFPTAAPVEEGKILHPSDEKDLIYKETPWKDLTPESDPSWTGAWDSSVYWQYAPGSIKNAFTEYMKTGGMPDAAADAYIRGIQQMPEHVKNAFFDALDSKVEAYVSAPRLEVLEEAARNRAVEEFYLGAPAEDLAKQYEMDELLPAPDIPTPMEVVTGQFSFQPIAPQLAIPQYARHGKKPATEEPIALSGQVMPNEPIFAEGSSIPALPAEGQTTRVAEPLIRQGPSSTWPRGEGQKPPIELGGDVTGPARQGREALWDALQEFVRHRKDYNARTISSGEYSGKVSMTAKDLAEETRLRDDNGKLIGEYPSAWSATLTNPTVQKYLGTLDGDRYERLANLVKEWFTGYPQAGSKMDQVYARGRAEELLGVLNNQALKQYINPEDLRALEDLKQAQTPNIPNLKRIDSDIEIADELTTQADTIPTLASDQFMQYREGTRARFGSNGDLVAKRVDEIYLNSRLQEFEGVQDAVLTRLRRDKAISDVTDLRHLDALHLRYSSPEFMSLDFDIMELNKLKDSAISEAEKAQVRSRLGLADDVTGARVQSEIDTRASINREKAREYFRDPSTVSNTTFDEFRGMKDGFAQRYGDQVTRDYESAFARQKKEELLRNDSRLNADDKMFLSSLPNNPTPSQMGRLEDLDNMVKAPPIADIESEMARLEEIFANPTASIAQKDAAKARYNSLSAENKKWFMNSLDDESFYSTITNQNPENYTVYRKQVLDRFGQEALEKLDKKSMQEISDKLLSSESAGRLSKEEKDFLTRLPNKPFNVKRDIQELSYIYKKLDASMQRYALERFARMLIPNSRWFSAGTAKGLFKTWTWAQGIGFVGFLLEEAAQMGLMFGAPAAMYGFTDEEMANWWRDSGLPFSNDLLAAWSVFSAPYHWVAGNIPYGSVLLFGWSGADFFLTRSVPMFRDTKIKGFIDKGYAYKDADGNYVFRSASELRDYWIANPDAFYKNDEKTRNKYLDLDENGMLGANCIFGAGEEGLARIYYYHYKGSKISEFYKWETANPTMFQKFKEWDENPAQRPAKPSVAPTTVDVPNLMNLTRDAMIAEALQEAGVKLPWLNGPAEALKKVEPSKNLISTSTGPADEQSNAIGAKGNNVVDYYAGRGQLPQYGTKDFQDFIDGITVHGGENDGRIDLGYAMNKGFDLREICSVVGKEACNASIIPYVKANKDKLSPSDIEQLNALDHYTTSNALMGIYTENGKFNTAAYMDAMGVGKAGGMTVDQAISYVGDAAIEQGLTSYVAQLAANGDTTIINNLHDNNNLRAGVNSALIQINTKNGVLDINALKESTGWDYSAIYTELGKDHLSALESGTKFLLDNPENRTREFNDALFGDESARYIAQAYYATLSEKDLLDLYSKGVFSENSWGQVASDYQNNNGVNLVMLGDLGAYDSSKARSADGTLNAAYVAPYIAYGSVDALQDIAQAYQNNPQATLKAIDMANRQAIPDRYGKKDVTDRLPANIVEAYNRYAADPKNFQTKVDTTALTVTWTDGRGDSHYQKIFPGDGTVLQKDGAYAALERQYNKDDVYEYTYELNQHAYAEWLAGEGAYAGMTWEEFSKQPGVYNLSYKSKLPTDYSSSGSKSGGGSRGYSSKSYTSGTTGIFVSAGGIEADVLLEGQKIGTTDTAIIEVGLNP